MSDESRQAMSKLLDRIQAAISKVDEEGGDIAALVERINASLFAMSMEHEIDGWPVIHIDPVARMIHVTIEGWSKLPPSAS